MSEYVIMTDSSCDLPADIESRFGIVTLPLTVTVGGKNYKNYLDGREITAKQFYDKLRAGEMAVTAAVNMGAFIEVMRPILASGKDILYLGFSSGLSATVQAGFMAADELRPLFPERKILCVDTLCASMGQGLAVYLVALEKEKGKTIEEVYEYAKKTSLRVIHWFTVEDLFFLKRGGRVNAATAIVGTMLNIKPVLHVDDEGHLINMGKARGRRASIKALFERLRDAADNHLKDQTVFISHGDCMDDVEYLISLCKEAGVKETVVSYVGPVIGAHTGPGVVAVFATGDVR